MLDEPTDHRSYCPDCLQRWGIELPVLRRQLGTALEIRDAASRNPVLADVYEKLDLLADEQNVNAERLDRLELDVKALRAALRYANRRLEAGNGGPSHAR